jgi:hypothetical protein
MRTAADWDEINLGDGVRLLLGSRNDHGGLDAKPVEIANDVGDVLRDAARNALTSLGKRSPKAYSTLGDADADEFLSLTIQPVDEGDQDAKHGPTETNLEEILSAADIVQLSLGAFGATDFLTRDELFGGGWLFYVVVVEVVDADAPIAFVRQYNPQRGFDPGRLLGVYGDTLKRINDPIFNFDLQFDVIVAHDEVAVLKATAFQRVFADINVVATEVPAHVGTLQSALNVAVSFASTVVLTTSCQDRLRMAARLKKLARQPHLSLVTPQSISTALQRHAFPPDRLGADDEIALNDLEDVRVFLDVLEKRYYEEDFTGDHMRADNASPRPA